MKQNSRKTEHEKKDVGKFRYRGIGSKTHSKRQRKYRKQDR